jgi:uncharacterized surface protein with fasciclin (FAS1) repeats
MKAIAIFCVAFVLAGQELTAANDLIGNTVADFSKGKNEFTTLLAALQAADLSVTLKGQGPFTLLAPNNAAFAKLPPGKLQELLKPENRDKLRALLLYHILPGKVDAASLKSGKVKTANGKEVEIVFNNNVARINGANILKSDIMLDNGVVHVIDTVLIPQ